MNDLHVDGKLATGVVENKDTDAATARLEGVGQTRPEVGLINDSQTLLDIASLGHGSDETVLHVKDTVLLEDRAEHGLHDNAGGRVRDERGLLVQLLGEQIHTKITVLASGRRGGDADDLARTTLEHQEVAEANVMARDGHGVGHILSSATAAGTGSRYLLANITDALVRVMLVVVLVRVHQLVSELVHALAERVVVT